MGAALPVFKTGLAGGDVKEKELPQVEAEGKTSSKESQQEQAKGITHLGFQKHIPPGALKKGNIKQKFTLKVKPGSEKQKPKVSKQSQASKQGLRPINPKS